MGENAGGLDDAGHRLQGLGEPGAVFLDLFEERFGGAPRLHAVVTDHGNQARSIDPRKQIGEGPPRYDGTGVVFRDRSKQESGPLAHRGLGGIRRDRREGPVEIECDQQF